MLSGYLIAFIELICELCPEKRGLTLYNTTPTFNDPREEAFENTVGKIENARDQHFLLFPVFF